MSTPRVSVVVPSYGGRHRLPTLLSALARQSDDDLEVVVVVDGDIDDTASLLAGPLPVPVHALVLPQNGGRAAALNAGFDAARGEILVRCDDDLEPGESYVAAHVAAHSTGEPGGVIGPCEDVLPDTPYSLAYGREKNAVVRRAQLTAGPEISWRYWGGNVSVRREVFDRIGPYDESFRRYGWEDVDWGYRLHRAGYPVRVVPDAGARHHGASVSARIRAQRAYLAGWSQRQFEAKHAVVMDELAAGPTTDPRPAGIWDRLVALRARDLDEETVARRGDRVDRGLTWLPHAVAHKRVALLVEAAAHAGYLQGAHDVQEKTPA